MYEIIDGVELFIGIINSFKQKKVNYNSPLEEIIIKSTKNNLAYVDNRLEALEKYDFDFWNSIKKKFKNEKDFLSWTKTNDIDERILYSKSEQFPDFIFKSRIKNNKLTCGSLLELKDSKGGSIASFNSTLPTKYKTLEEVDIINGNDLITRIASIMDDKLSSFEDYYYFQRRCFYLIRTHKDNKDRVKISIVDGSFFETVSKEHLIYQMFLNIFRSHLEKNDIKIKPELLSEIEKSLSYITDQTIIASSQNIEESSIKPRLRIMAEVHSEGNPHSNHYPDILENSINLIIKLDNYKKEIDKFISKNKTDIHVFNIKHKRNGEHKVFQFRF